MPQKILSKIRSYNLDKISLLTTLYINLLILKNKDAKIAIHRLPMIKEAGEVEEKIVAQELFAEVRTQARILSSVEGVRQMIRIPFSILRNLAARTKINDLSNTETRKETLKMKKFKLILIIVILLIALVVSIQNTESVETKFLLATIKLPRVLLLLLTFTLGFAGGLIAASFVLRKPAKSKDEVKA